MDRPTDTASYGGAFLGSDTFFPLAPRLEIGVRYSVYISHVVDGPNQFFMQIVSGGVSQQFDQMMNEIAESYMTIGKCRPTS